MVFEELQKRVLSSPSFTRVFERIDIGGSFTLSGLEGALLSIFLVGVVKEKKRKVLFILPDEDISYWEELYPQLGSSLLVFPPWGTYPYEHKLPALHRMALRLRSLALLDHSNSTGQLILATPRAIMEPTYPKKSLDSYSVTLRCGDEVPIEELKSMLLNLGYSNAGVVEFLGDFSSRGGVVDFFSCAHDDPIRVEFFGDTIESIRTFSAMTQRSLEKIDSARILPVHEFVRDFWFANLENSDPLEKSIIPGLKEKFKQSCIEELFARIQIDREFPGFNWFSFLFYPTPASLFDHLPSDTLIITGSLDELKREFEAYIAEAENYYKLEDRTSLPYPHPEDIYINGEKLLLEIERFQKIELVEGGEGELRVNGKSAPYLPQDSYLLKSEIESRKAKGERIYLGLRTKTRLDTLEEAYPDIPAFVTRFRSGFELPEIGISLLVSPPFKRSVLTALPRPFKEGNADYYSLTLEKGDLVIHSDYGLGKFIGLETIEADGKLTECLILEYADKEKLFVPVEDFHKVSKYLGGKEDVKLASLKKMTFRKVRERARERIREYAGELLQLYILRKSMKGFSFKEDSGLLEEFIEAFPYEETEDQAKCWQEIKRDMESYVPMDRLVTGEVGFGKTEMAMRAAFKAVLCKKQVAVLAPTTVLANQHYQTFSERFKNYPVNIELISRVRTPGEQKEILKRLAEGKIDIVIGTHRLLSQDVKFHDLGLLIIDEEQKFGVAQKEKLKMWQQGVDVLTITATPIPRTLYFSLGGVRDLSIINSPPEGRKPIYTEIVEFKPEVIVEAIRRELERDGQVYFLHNRVQSINQMKHFLENLMPDVSIGVAHGQMKPAELQDVMERFINREFDVLVTTTIIEAGTDIPNVNTLIVNRADKFGLAQLYQLRGRVGRSDKQAYAYFLIPPYKTLPKKVRARLKAIMEYSELGSSFQLALRDLEIRGAGNILGEEQHGFIDEIGLDLYIRFLREAVNELQRTTYEPIVPVPFEVDFSLGIPKEYIPDFELRLEFYRRAYLADSLKRLENLREEMIDRFGKLPEMTELMFIYLRMRIIASSIPIERIGIRSSKIRIIFKKGFSPGWYRLQQFLSPYGLPVRVEPSVPAEISIDTLESEPRKVLEFLERLLYDLKDNIIDENLLSARLEERDGSF